MVYTTSQFELFNFTVLPHDLLWLALASCIVGLTVALHSFRYFEEHSLMPITTDYGDARYFWFTKLSLSPFLRNRFRRKRSDTLSLVKFIWRRLKWTKYEYAALVEWYWQMKSEVPSEEYVPQVPHCPPQIPHELAFDWTISIVVNAWRLTYWVMLRPLKKMARNFTF